MISNPSAETPVASKLEALLNLQRIDSQLDEIRRVRGDLPEEVRDLEDEIAGYEVRVGKFDEEIAALNDQIKQRKQNAKDADGLIKRYEDQQTNVRNNREYEAIAKEIELQKLEIQISEKKIKEAQYQIELKNTEISGTKQRLEERKKDLDNKKAELETIVGESESDEKKLMDERGNAVQPVEDRLLMAYTRIRGNVRNGLAVVTVKRDACGGCFNTVPPQRQADIIAHKKIIVCEHCGRVLADVEARNA
ncbi:C4-type zinc ribbon domain-containing protein [Hymenobacter sp. 5516J-16]|uniref:C4-type zinc ribbon domain-containing protein n=1 Tax=Hymenobacter sublimis TaxID=2933777 RepID=A0ABY4JER0_9BACT|nr:MULTISPECIES: C4-type zinc ribbon domain-containing protein [Hymenobacter]UOQ77414.1 C4-type zinc ribbon domain-containing protein [Hymenobacter sp. 5516J-16]UPL51090.1 C4-type zinc ribbon domain-containing protein [Hymenobacter sublimis]